MKQKIEEIILNMEVGEYKYIRRNIFSMSIEEFQNVYLMLMTFEKAKTIAITDLHHENYTELHLVDLIQIQRLK